MHNLEAIRAAAARIAAGRATAVDMIEAHAVLARQAYARNVKAGA
jgi:hypothetical protein